MIMLHSGTQFLIFQVTVLLPSLRPIASRLLARAQLIATGVRSPTALYYTRKNVTILHKS